MQEIEYDLMNGNAVECANVEGGCAYVIIKGRPYVMKDEYMFCCQECADESERLRKAEGHRPDRIRLVKR